MSRLSVEKLRGGSSWLHNPRVLTSDGRFVWSFLALHRVPSHCIPHLGHRAMALDLPSQVVFHLHIDVPQNRESQTLSQQNVEQ